MSKTFTVLSFVIATATCAYMFTGNIQLFCITGIITTLLCCFFFWIEKFFMERGSEFFSALSYFFSKAKEYLIKEKTVIYSYVGNNTWTYEKKYKLVSKARGMESYDERFCWSADSKSARIEAVYEGQTIRNLRNQGIWTKYTVHFGEIKNKGELIQTGSKVVNLFDPDKSARPFLSITSDNKTKLLQMIVRVPSTKSIESARLLAYPSSTANKEAYSNDLVFVENIGMGNLGEIKASIPYPRLNWMYMIIWDEC